MFKVTHEDDCTEKDKRLCPCINTHIAALDHDLVLSQDEVARLVLMVAKLQGKKKKGGA